MNGWYCVIFTNQYNRWRRGLPTDQMGLNYGLKLSPNPSPGQNKYTSANSSNYGIPSVGPLLQVDYTSQLDDYKLKLRWPLSTPKPAQPSTPFGAPWGPGITKCKGLEMVHAGVDIPNSVGNPIYASEDGIVRQITDGRGSNFAYAVTMEHNQLNGGGKYTTVSWHINPSVKLGDFVPKGRQLGTIASIGTSDAPATPHLHFGIRLGSFVYNLSDKGALPRNYCPELPSYPEQFIGAWETNRVIFQQ